MCSCNSCTQQQENVTWWLCCITCAWCCLHGWQMYLWCRGCLRSHLHNWNVFRRVIAIKLLEKTSWVSRGLNGNFDLMETSLTDHTKEVLAELREKSIMELLLASQNVHCSKISKIVCSLKRKQEPESKPCLLFPDGFFILWNQSVLIHANIHSPGHGNISQHATVITSVIRGWELLLLNI